MSKTITVQGTVHKSELGVGTWSIRGGGRTYEIYKAKPEDMLVEGKHVRVTGRVRDDVMTIAMIGPVFEVDSYEEVGN